MKQPTYEDYLALRKDVEYCASWFNHAMWREAWEAHSPVEQQAIMADFRRHIAEFSGVASAIEAANRERDAILSAERDRADLAEAVASARATW